jgi:cholesterol transport system auxiliary component
MKRALTQIAAAAVLALIAASCGSVPATKYYQLSVPSITPPANAEPFPVTLLVGPISASHLYREDHLVFAASAEQMGTYEYQHWVAPPTEMIEELLLRDLRATGRYRSVAQLTSSSRGDFVLHGHLYDFKEISGSPMAARVTIDFELRDVKANQVVWSNHYNHDEPVDGKSVPAVVAALDRNMQQAAAQVRSGLESYFASHSAR